MKKLNYQIFLLLLLTSIGFSAFSSEKELILQTNKQIYISGDNVAFKCTMADHSVEENNILYVDICGEGYTITSQLLIRQNSHWDGQIALPDTLQTGVYLFRAYIGSTQGTPSIVSQPIAIFNRFGNNEINEFRKTKANYVEFQLPTFPTTNSDKLKINAVTGIVSSNKAVEFEIKNNIEGAIGGTSFSIYKTVDDSFITEIQEEVEYDSYASDQSIKIYNKLYLRGKVKNHESGLPMVDETVLLSVPDSLAYINYDHTNSLGEFKFLLSDFYGMQDMIVQTINKNKQLDIELYPILLAAPAKIPFYIPVSIEESKFVNQAITRSTIHKAYGVEVSKQKSKVISKFPFYGLTENRVYPNVFVDLNDFEEIAWEILPTVKFRREQKEATIKLWDPESKAFYDKPWLLVDGVPVFNAENLNVLDSRKINWIEIQPEIRCYGDLFIEGLLAVQTYNGQFNDVALPNNAVRLQVDTYYDNNDQQSTDQPLFKDVLYWSPLLESNNSTQKISIETSNEKGNYIAIVQTVDTNGSIQYASYKFTVE